MATSAQSSHGTQFQVGDGAEPEVFTTVAEVRDITGPGNTVDTLEVTNHDSGGWKEYIAMLSDGGEVSFDLNYYGDASQSAMRTDQAAKTLRNYQVVIPFATTPENLTFAGYVTSFSYAFPVAGVAAASVTIKITGAVTSDLTP